MSDISLEMKLRQLYYENGQFHSLDNLYRLSRELGYDVSREDIQRWLKQQKVYTMHKRMPGVKRFRKTRVYDLGQQIQLDLIDFRKYDSQNDGYRFILVGIEILSRFAFALPIKKKNQEEVLESIESLLKDFQVRFGDYPQAVQFDEGKEFKNRKLKNYLDALEISHFSTHSFRKSAIVERLNRSLIEKLRKIWTVERDFEWVSHLHDIVEAYNARKHRVFGMAPKDVNEENKFTVWGRQFGVATERVKPKFKVGDLVRVYHFRTIYRTTAYRSQFQKYFRKKYNITGRTNTMGDKPLSPFSEETFRIIRVIPTQDGFPVYRISSVEMPGEKQETILGTFYESELSLHN